MPRWERSDSGDRPRGKLRRSQVLGCFLRVVKVSMPPGEERVGLVAIALSGRIVARVVKWILPSLQ